MTVRIFTGDCRQVLATLPDESVHMVCTSPPYWGLRDYKVPPSVWGGDADCEHEWGNVQDHGKRGKRGQSFVGGNYRPRAVDADAGGFDIGGGKFCRRCNAWRGVLGLEPTPELHVEHIVEVFREVRRVLRKDGTLWLNYGDCYATSANGTPAAEAKARQWQGKASADDRTFRDKPFSTVSGGLKAKDLVMMPSRIALALQADGWWLRSEIIWAKPNPMPESITDRPTSSHEKLFLLTKSARYFYDAEAVRTPAVSDTTKAPDGWDTDPGAHGTVHRMGRVKGKKTDKQAGHGRRHAGFNDRWEKRKRGLPPRHAQYDSSTRESLDDVVRGTGANLRNVWHIATHPYPDAHFATFPPALVVPCIKAGTSEKGVCPVCGVPWERDTQSDIRPGPKANRKFPIGERTIIADQGDQGANRLKDGHKKGHYKHTETLGWSPSCKCKDNNPIPATVLDPFGGSGTVGLVADRLGRDAILIELNPEYADMARARITDDAPLFAPLSSEAPAKAEAG